MRALKSVRALLRTLAESSDRRCNTPSSMGVQLDFLSQAHADNLATRNFSLGGIDADVISSRGLGSTFDAYQQEQDDALYALLIKIFQRVEVELSKVHSIVTMARYSIIGAEERERVVRMSDLHPMAPYDGMPATLMTVDGFLFHSNKTEDLAYTKGVVSRHPTYEEISTYMHSRGYDYFTPRRVRTHLRESYAVLSDSIEALRD